MRRYKLIQIVFALLVFFGATGCISLKTSYHSSSATGLGTNEKNSKKILKTVREKTYAGIFGKVLFGDTLNLSKSNIEKLEKELNRISDLVYKVGNRNWQTANFGVPVILVPRLSIKINSQKNEIAFANCDNKKYTSQISIGLIRKLYMNSIVRAIELQNKQTRELGSLANFRILNAHDYLVTLLNLKGQKLGIFTGLSMDKLDRFTESMDAALELERMSKFISLEFFKALLFVIGHENYHSITDCEVSKEAETYADVFSAIIYQLTIRDNSNNQDAIIGFFFGEEYDSKKLPTILEFVTGRSISDIISNMYKNTKFEEGNATHMPLDKRLEFLNNNLDLNNLDKVYSVIGNKILFDYQSKNK